MVINNRSDRWNQTSAHLSQLLRHNLITGLFAYDIAAAYLIAKESHCVISDSRGEPLDDKSLISKNILSCVAASNTDLHQKLINWLEKSA
jgi:fructose-1,6-bisphosphatase/inositol monophosphatase family enzyme